MLIWTSLSIYQQLKSQTDLKPALYQMLLALKNPVSLMQFLFAILLMPLNWFLETAKLYLLLKSEVKISFRHTLEAVLSGLAFSMNTPNRIGEYFGRILSLEKGQRLIGANFSIVSGLSQLFVTMTAGFVSIIIFKDLHESVGNSAEILGYITSDVFMLLLFFACLLLLASYFFYTSIVQALCKLLPIKKMTTLASGIKKIPSFLLLTILTISIVRFIIFTTQYLLILHAFGVKFEYHAGFAFISIIYLVMAIIPTIAFAELGIRGKVALIVAGGFTNQLLALTAGTVFVWILNLVLPAIIGTTFLWKINLRSSS